MARLNDPDEIRRLLVETEVWAIVGLSNNPQRPAYSVSRFLQEHGKRIVPVHPTAATVHGEQGYTSLSEIPFDVDVVEVFLRATQAGAIADEALQRPEIKGVWFPLGVVNPDAADRVLAAGRIMVMDRCPAIEWPRLVG